MKMMKMKRKTLLLFLTVLLSVLTVSCGKTQEAGGAAEEGTDGTPLSYDHSMELDYAQGFAVDYYDGGYALITISDGSRFFIVPEGQPVPEELPGDEVEREETAVLEQPADHIYLAATAVMDMFCSIDALDAVILSGTKEDGWYIEEAKEAMASGEIEYAGKYNMPDYEKILDSGCKLAVESTMILHSPEVKEKLENIGIPVLIDRSSYEEHPLGRTEWVKLYGVLLGKEEVAEQVFEQQKLAMESIADAESTDSESTGKTVAFFYITSNETASVRKSGDYVPKMIELAGGEYIFSDLGDDTASSSVNMQMEEFYAGAKDADYLIYNSTIDGGVESLKQLLAKSPLLEDFKAVREGHVYCTTRNLYQDSMKLGTFISDIHTMLTAEETEDEGFTYLFQLR